ncbi:MAG: hypothetical protein ACOX5G_14165 [Kiritimatiellia bacterium]|jgi:hypothetical protein
MKKRQVGWRVPGALSWRRGRETAGSSPSWRLWGLRLMLATGLALGMAIPEARGDKAAYTDFVQVYVVGDANRDGSWNARPVARRIHEVFLPRVGDDAMAMQAIGVRDSGDVYSLKVAEVAERGIVLSPRRDCGLDLSGLHVGVTRWQSWWTRSRKAVEKLEASARIARFSEQAQFFLQPPYRELVIEEAARTPVAHAYWRGIRSELDAGLQEVVKLSEAELIERRGALTYALKRCRALAKDWKDDHDKDSEASWEGDTVRHLQRAEDALNKLESRGVLRIINRSGRDLEVRLDTIRPSTYSLSQWVVEKRGAPFRLVAGGSYDLVVSEEPRWRRCSWRLPGSEIERGGDVREVKPGKLVEWQIKGARE